MKYLLSCIFLIVCMSCKSDSSKTDKKDNQPTQEKTDQIESFNFDSADGKYRLVFNGVFEKDDLMLIYYTTQEGEVLTSEKFKTQEVKGKPEYQQIVFEFGNNNKPYNLRIDFSDSKSQEFVKFKSIILIDAYNKLVINNENLY